VLCVVSDDYLKAPYSTLERNAAQWQAAKNRPGFVLFVVVKPSRLPTLSDHFRRCELFGVPEEAARQRFRDFIAKREMPEIAAFPGKAAAVSNIAVHVPEHFMGRDEAFAAIEKGLGRYAGRVAVTALYGLRGVGKTVLAAAYARAASRRLPRHLADTGRERAGHAGRSGRAWRAAQLGSARREGGARHRRGHGAAAS
jgi:hypothetical protein